MSLYIRYFAPVNRAGHFDVRALRRHAQTYARRNIVAALVIVLVAMDFAQVLVLLSFPFVAMAMAATVMIVANGLEKGRRK